jgi:beta-1,4-N-acetylglucosaminyltransferase
MKFTSQKSNILIVFGHGGHAEQMTRLLKSIDGKHNKDYLAIVERGAALKDETLSILKIFSVIPIRPKKPNVGKLNLLWQFIRSFVSSFQITIKLLLKSKVKLMISTGPGIAIPIALICRLFNCRVIHLETWCRFYTKSFTGKFMYHLATDFWIQNKELSTLYPKATYVGRL